MSVAPASAATLTYGRMDSLSAMNVRVFRKIPVRNSRTPMTLKASAATRKAIHDHEMAMAKETMSTQVSALATGPEGQMTRTEKNTARVFGSRM
ncbi:hypothetical protein GCM10017790_32990 [Amycolatopsis oliviviridis]|uniref:Uncharacterized protein n=1 Tax=Amycolatopsis oliviviridis TaxID=1471590 RepID=A0ABQ3LJ40_9PSEU|nr:hypothetical protein GCM10017790_32990 [Amycolatopsis oliviviridis]